MESILSWQANCFRALLNGLGMEVVCGVMSLLMELSWMPAGPQGRQIQLSAIVGS